jgi:hypothetical protein
VSREPITDTPARETGPRDLAIETRQLESPPSQPQPAIRYEMPARTITADPESLQFRAQANREGLEPGRVIDEPYDPKKGGVIAVWRDPESGETKVVNGHHRLAAAQRDNADVAVVYIDAPTAAEARTQGALLNIDEDHADLRDAVQLILDGGFTKEDLAKLGISRRSTVARDAEAVASLAPGIRASWQAGEMDDAVAAAIGKAALTPDQQAVIQKVYNQQKAKGRDLPASQVGILARRVKAAPEVSATGQEQGSIFDVLGEERGQNLFVERAALEDWLVGQLSRDKRLFGGVTKHAARLSEGGTRVDVAQGQQIAAESTQAADVVRRLADVAGPVSAALNQAATRIANGEPSHAVRAELLYEARAAAREELGRAAETRSDASREGTRDERLSDAAADGVLPDEGVDRLDTGEAQPRLPEAGAVREREIVTPPVADAPFSLTADTAARQEYQPTLSASEPVYGEAKFRQELDETRRRLAAHRATRTSTLKRIGDPANPNTAASRSALSKLDEEITTLVERERWLQRAVIREQGGSGSSEASMGSIGDASDLPVKPGTVPTRPRTLLTPEDTTALMTTRHVEFPELVEVARELIGTPQVVKRFRKEGKLGEFNAASGRIRLHADLFKPGQERQLVATLAHEIGHFADWLPDYTLKRGNLLGRLRSLHAFLKGSFTAADGTTIKDRDVRAELKALSMKWRPWDPATASPSFAAYRNSGKELYADALSVLLNNPGLLEADAPTFYRQFFEELDRKPDVKQAYFDLQTLLSGTREELIARRRGGVREMFEGGDAKAMEIERLRQAEALASRQNLWLRIRIQHVDKNAPVIDRVKDLERRGIRVPEDEDPRYFLEERNYLGGLLKAFAEKHFQPVYEATQAGDRSDVANPRGITPTVADELYDDLKRAFSPEQRRVLREQITKFRAGVRAAAEGAYRSGLYKPERYEQMRGNESYVPFRVIDHLEQDVTSRVHHQVGTLKDIQNPADAAILKTLVTIRATEYQKMKMATFAFLERHYPGDIEQAKHTWDGKGIVPIDPPNARTQALVTYYEKGRLRGKWVDPYIADSLNNASVGRNWAFVAALRWVNGHWFRPVFTTLNLGFQTFNLGRDFFRFWKNTPHMTFKKAMRRYWEAVPMAKVRAFGLRDQATPKEMEAYLDLVDAEEARILSITFNDLLDGRKPEDTQIEDTFSKLGIGKGDEQSDSAVKTAAVRLLNGIKRAGDFIESLPKAAGIYEFKGAGSIAGISPAQRSFIRRKIGSPDFLAGGTYKPATNELLLFSNAITQAIRADLEVARDPQTRSGFWWKTAAMNVAPKLAIFAALYLLPDDEDWDQVKGAFQGISEYDLTNYLPVPLGRDEHGNTIYLRIPQDDFGRLIGGLVWKALGFARGDKDALQAAMQVFDYTAGQVPSVTPVVQLAADAATFAAGGNVYDPFRNRFLFTEDELKAPQSVTCLTHCERSLPSSWKESPLCPE